MSNLRPAFGVGYMTEISGSNHLRGANVYMVNHLISSIMTILFAIGLTLSSFFSPCSVDALGDSDATMLSNTDLIKQAGYLSEEEKAMVWEVNLVRKKPESYIPFVYEMLWEAEADSVRLSAIQSETIRKRVSYVGDREIVEYDTTYNNYYKTRVTAMRELILELKETPSLNELIPSSGLYLAAEKHGYRQAPSNYIDHLGEDGSWPLDRIKEEAQWVTDGNENIARGLGSPRDIILQLLIDSGVPERGHRKNILNPEWEFVACHNVNTLDDREMRWWLQEFAY